MAILERTFPTTRRRVLQGLALLGIGSSGVVRAASPPDRPLATNDSLWPEMTYRTLGRTDFLGSRLVFGCGAALMLWEKNELLDEAFEALSAGPPGRVVLGPDLDGGYYLVGLDVPPAGVQDRPLAKLKDLLRHSLPAKILGMGQAH